MAEVKRYMQGWLNYYAIASMKKTMEEWNGWLRRRIRMYIWKQWKKPKTKYRSASVLIVISAYDNSGNMITSTIETATIGSSKTSNHTFNYNPSNVSVIKVFILNPSSYAPLRSCWRKTIN